MRKANTTTRLIATAAEWRLFSLLLTRPHARWADEVSALAREVRHRDLRAAAKAACGATEGEYLWLFGPGGAVSPRAVSYRGFEDPGQILAALSAFYDAFGFQPRSEDPIDHVAVLTDFVGFLLLKEAYARTNGDRTAATTTATARELFLKTQLSPMAGAMAERLAPAEGTMVAAAVRLLAKRVPRHRAPATAIDPLSGCGACELGAAD